MEGLSLGLGLSYFDGSEALPGFSLERRAAKGFEAPGGWTKQNSTPVENSDWGVTAGVVWSVNEQWSTGTFFRQGPELGPTFPDVYGLGAAFRNKPGNLTLSFEWDRVQYSSLLDNLESDASGLVLDDADELHLGAEYVFLKTTPIFALRAGAWLDPDHRVRSGLDPRRDDDVHYSAGIGFVFSRWQIDAGLDVSEVSAAGSVSAIFSF
jgi:hypothetical protein